MQNSPWDNPNILEAITNPANKPLLSKLPYVIAFAGQARSGKDTSGLIVNDLTRNSVRYAFADPIRAMLKAGFGIDMYDPYWIERKEEVIPWIGKSPRQMMQTLGTEWGREHVNTNLWVSLAFRRILQAEEKGETAVIITDFRFPNEGDFLRALGACIIHIDRPGLPPIKDNGHVSEAKMFRASTDYTVINDDLQFLPAKLQSVLTDYASSRVRYLRD